VIIPGAIEERTYWIVGDGDPIHGNCMGWDSVWKDADDNVVGASVTRPAGAPTVTEGEYDTALAAFNVELTQVADDLPAWFAQQKADHDALATSARAKLVAGDPLTAEEAALLTGGL
jgi:hypothetical protein